MLQCVAAPVKFCSLSLSLFNFHTVKPKTVSFNGPYRNAVATFVLPAIQAARLLELASGHLQIDFARSSKGSQDASHVIFVSKNRAYWHST